MKVTIHWFRRDLRIEDNTALYHALESGHDVLPVFIFDPNIIKELPRDDARVSFIHQTLSKINKDLKKWGSGIKIIHDTPGNAWGKIINEFDISEVYINKDYEIYGVERDQRIENILAEKGIPLKKFQDHVVFEPHEILKDDGKPYSVYTPYKNKWLKRFDKDKMTRILPKSDNGKFYQSNETFPELEELGFHESTIKVENYSLSILDQYHQTRDIPHRNATSFLGPHLRFGTVSIRSIINELGPDHQIFLSELIWREFFMQIFSHYPRVINQNFKIKYNGIQWRNDKDEFQKWCSGKTGYPIVDAGMRQLNATGYMHNRVRMITASFLCKHLLIDWRWGEAYFAEKLLDFELSSNNGNWQWVSGTGCDAAPYFRVFNPTEQTKKFDKELKYINRWVPELNDLDYVPMVDHKMARQRALDVYKKGLQNDIS